MNENLQEFVNSRGVGVRVDREQGVIRGVKLLGLQSTNGRRYLPTALAAAAGLYEGAKVNVNHPKGHPLGRTRLSRPTGIDPQRQRSRGRVLVRRSALQPQARAGRPIGLGRRTLAENVGFSHNVEARTGRQNGQTVVEAILKVQSVDLVADPATTRGLYESVATDTITTTPAAAAVAEFNARRVAHGKARPGRCPPGRVGRGVAGPARRSRASAGPARRGHARRATVVRLLSEFKLPHPDGRPIRRPGQLSGAVPRNAADRT